MLEIKARLKQKLLKTVLNTLRRPEVEAQLWESVHRPRRRHKAQDIQSHLYRKAAEEAADYVKRHMPPGSCYDHNAELFDAALEAAGPRGLYLELGVAAGKSISRIARRVTQTVHGFDSFEGLPEGWIPGGMDEGAFNKDGRRPRVPDNVELHAGWFDQSLPRFAAIHQEPIAFMNVDCDLYSSTKSVFDALGDQITAGTVIRFGEYFNYPGWEQHEYRAFQEFIEEKQLAYRYLGFARRNYSVAVVIEGPRNKT